MTAPRPARPKSSDKRKRAVPVADWLEFIRPHVEEYEARARGDQRSYVVKLSSQQGQNDQPGTSVNTLRRFIAAAKFLETLGITRLPAGLKHLPVGSVEAIARISKKDPALGHRLLQELLKGDHTIQTLKTELARFSTPGSARRIDAAVVRVFTEQELRALLAGVAPDTDPGAIGLKKFSSSDTLPDDLDPLARPRLVAHLSENRRALVFDESTIAWKASAERARREFIRNVKIATADFDFVVVFCSALYVEVERRRPLMLKTTRDRVLVQVGRLEIKLDRLTEVETLALDRFV